MQSKLLHKVNKSGIAGKLYDWLGGFLHDRSQSLRVNNVNSKSSNVLSGVSHGCVLGPILFFIFINDICSVSDNHNVSVKLFSDDIKLYSFIDTNAGYSSLQNHLNLFCTWSLFWQLGLSRIKYITLSLNSSTCSPCYSVDSTLLNNVSSYNDLGVIEDHPLKFDCSIDQMYSKVN